jgi:hypothetical protein
MNNFKSWIAKLDTIRDPIYYFPKSLQITVMNYPLSGIQGKDQADNKILSYPNPFDSFLYLETNSLNASYSIYDLSGRTLKSGILSGPNTMLNTVNFSKGMYLAKISTATKDTVLKIVKQ